MQKPRLQDYGITEVEIDAAKESKAKSEEACIKTSMALWVAIIVMVGVMLYPEEPSIAGLALTIFIALFGGSVYGIFALMIGMLLWEGWWNVAHPQYRKVLSRHSKYETALKEYNAWQQRLLESFWKGLNGRQFEVELGNLFSKLGYNVEITPSSRDSGIDLVLKNRGVETIVQCKRFNNPAGVAVVRELYGVLRDSEADDALLACTGGFTRGVYDFVKGKPIRLLGLKEILELQKSLSLYEGDLTKPLRSTS